MNTPRPPTDATDDPLLQAYADADRLLGTASPEPADAVRDRVLAAALRPAQGDAPAVAPVPQRKAAAANSPRWRWAAIAASVCTVSLATLVALRVQMESPPEAFVRDAPVAATTPAPVAAPAEQAAAEAVTAQQKAAETRHELRRRESARRSERPAPTPTPAPPTADAAGTPAPATQAAAPAAMAPPGAPPREAEAEAEAEVDERRAGLASEAPAAKALQAPAPVRRSAAAAEGSISPALHRAAETGQPDAVRQALAAGADVNGRNRDGRTALLEAVQRSDGSPQYTEIVKLLLAHGADPNLADRAGVTPLQHARQRGYTAMAQAIEEAGGR